MFPLSLFMKTTLAKNVQLKDKTWYVVDAKDQVLGRVAVNLDERLEILRINRYPFDLLLPNSFGPENIGK